MSTDDVQSEPQLARRRQQSPRQQSRRQKSRRRFQQKRLSFPTSTCDLQQLTAELQPDTAPEVPTTEVPPIRPPKARELSGIELRLKQLDEYRENATQYRNRLTANIRRANADLMEAGALVADRVLYALKSGTQSEDLAEQAAVSLDLLLKVSDHAGKLADLEMHLNKEDKLADPFRLF